MRFLKIDGLEVYQSILLLLGCLLFLVVIIGIIFNFVKRDPVKRYLPFIGFSIIMIGFSGIKEISFLNYFKVIMMESEEIMKNPSNEAAYKNLEETIAKFDSTLVYSAKNLTVMAKAKTLLGKHNEGIEYADKALKQDQNFAPAKETKILAESSQAIEKLMINPDDNQEKNKLTEKVGYLERLTTQSTYTSLKIAEAYLFTGRTEKAKTKANDILFQNPREAKANKIKQLAEVEEEIQKVRENPTDSVAFNNVKRSINDLKKESSFNALRNATISKGYQSLGNPDMKRRYIDSTKHYLRNRIKR